MSDAYSDNRGREDISGILLAKGQRKRKGSCLLSVLLESGSQIVKTRLINLTESMQATAVPL